VKHYADTSFVASLYLPNDRHFSLACDIAEKLPVGPGLPLTPFGVLELRNVFARLEWSGAMHRADSEAILREVRKDLEAGFFTASPLRAYIWMEAAMEAVATITPRTGTRTLDAMHVGLARVHGAKAFVSFDANQRRAALVAGLKLVPTSLA
jgi:predicted nucleic acid-binding protein